MVTHNSRCFLLKKYLHHFRKQPLRHAPCVCQLYESWMSHQSMFRTENSLMGSLNISCDRSCPNVLSSQARWPKAVVQFVLSFLLLDSQIEACRCRWGHLRPCAFVFKCLMQVAVGEGTQGAAFCQRCEMPLKFVPVNEKMTAGYQRSSLCTERMWADRSPSKASILRNYFTWFPHFPHHIGSSYIWSLLFCIYANVKCRYI